jgi:hypothetical protein
MVEIGTGWVLRWAADSTRSIAIAEVGLVEIAAAFAAKLRGKFITHAVYQQAREDLIADAQLEYLLVEIDRPLVNRAIELTEQHRLRGYDAIHLACGLRLNDALTAQALAPLVFISADNALLTAATEAGLLTDNPNNYLDS